MWRVAADHAAERDDAGEPAGLRERHRSDRQLEGARHGHHGDRVGPDAARAELVEGGLEQPAGDVAVEAADDDPDGTSPPLGLSLEDGIPGRHDGSPGACSELVSSGSSTSGSSTSGWATSGSATSGSATSVAATASAMPSASSSSGSSSVSTAQRRGRPRPRRPTLRRAHWTRRPATPRGRSRSRAPRGSAAQLRSPPCPSGSSIRFTPSSSSRPPRRTARPDGAACCRWCAQACRASSRGSRGCGRSARSRSAPARRRSARSR